MVTSVQCLPQWIPVPDAKFQEAKSEIQMLNFRRLNLTI